MYDELIKSLNEEIAYNKHYELVSPVTTTVLGNYILISFKKDLFNYSSDELSKHEIFKFARKFYVAYSPFIIGVIGELRFKHDDSWKHRSFKQMYDEMGTIDFKEDEIILNDRLMYE